MDKAILEKIKSDLLAEKKKLEAELSEFAQKDVKLTDNYRSEFPQFGDKEDENAAEVAEYSDRLSLEHVLEKQLRDVNQALVSMEKGKYGICRYCHNPIEEKRLLIRPTSNSCVACKKKLKGEE